MNFSALGNLTTLEFNITALEDPETIVPALVESGNTVSGGYLGLGIMIAVFIILVYTLYRNDGDMKMGIARSLMLSSGFSSVIGIVMLVTGLISSFVHVMWFLMIFMISMIAVFNLKRKGF